MKKLIGQREVRSVVDSQLNCVLPERRLLLGNSGEGRTILPASRIRLSQKISSAFVPATGAARGLVGFFPPGGTRLSVLSPGSLTSSSDATIPIKSDTRSTSASSVSSTPSLNGPTLNTSPGA